MPFKRFVLIDDEGFTEDMVEGTLEGDLESPYVLHSYSNGNTALEEIKAMVKKGRVPDAILLDYNMPGMNGREVLVKLDSQKATRHIPVIAIGAFPEGEVQGTDRYVLPKMQLMAELPDYLNRL